jgi:hypothetical protein
MILLTHGIDTTITTDMMNGLSRRLTRKLLQHMERVHVPRLSVVEPTAAQPIKQYGFSTMAAQRNFKESPPAEVVDDFPWPSVYEESREMMMGEK